MLILILMIPLEVLLLWRTSKRQLVLPCPHFLMTYIIGSQICLSVAALGFVDIGELVDFSSFAFIDFYNQLQFMYFALFLFLYVMTMQSKVVHIFSTLKPHKGNPHSIGILAAFYVYAIFHFLMIDKQILWSNSEYLLLGDPRTLSTSNSAIQSLFGSFVFFGFALNVFMVVALHSRCVIVFLCYLPLSIWWFAFELAGHSRVAVLYLALIACLMVILRVRAASFFVPVLLSGAVATLYASLGGRGSGLHGLVSIRFYFDDIATTFSASGPFEPILNVFSGIFNTSELFSWTGSHDFAYKVLSFSPLTSTLDQFADVRGTSELRINDFMPMSALQEIYSFGAPYIVFYFAVIAAAIVLNIRSLSKSVDVTAMIANLFIALAWYMQDSYSVRNVFRFYYISIALSVTSDLWRRRRRSVPG